MGAPPETMVFVRQYMVIWYAAALLMAFPIASTACLRAKGLSGAPELGFVGAAWATLGANLVGTLLARIS